MRERKSTDDVVAARLRSVMIGPGPASSALPRARPPVWPPVLPPVIAPADGVSARRRPGGFSGHAGDDFVWPDDVDLGPVDLGPVDPESSEVVSVSPSRLPSVSPDLGVAPVSAEPAGAVRLPERAIAEFTVLTEPFLSMTGEADTAGIDTEPAPATRRPLPPPAWVLPAPEVQDPPSPADAEAFPGYQWVYAGDEPSGRDDRESARLSAAGAFGAKPEDARRAGLRAFDPGRRGVKALAVVAAVVVLVAAVLAWRARPHVDSVAPPAFDPAGSSAGPSGAGSSSTGPLSGRSGVVPAGGGGGVPNDASAAVVVVAVAGKVRRPGLVRLPAGARVADVLAAAGGADPGVDVAMLNLARKVADGELILVGVTPPPAATLGAGPAAPAAGAPAGGPVNLNTATLADLDGLPGVGPVLAQRILDARAARGGFQAVGDLRKVSGIGDAKYEQLKDLVTV